MKTEKLSLIFIMSFCWLSFCWAQNPKSGVRSPASSALPTLTYDLSGSAGTYNDKNYTEINLGLNWSMQDWLIWRNALFTRFGSGIDSISGLDTSLRLAQNFRTDGGTFGLDLFAGPGLRIANQNSNAIFAEAGLGLKLGGLYIGGGAKSLYYTSTRTSSTGAELPHNDTQIFIIFGGGGAF